MDYRLAVDKTLAYGSFFHYPMSPAEIHFWLIGSRTTKYSSIKKFLPGLSIKEKKLKTSLFRLSKEKRELAQKATNLLRFVPFVRLVALTGSVAANNSKKNDDIDLFIVTSANTLWLVRPITLILLSLIFSRRHPKEDSSQIANRFCPNLWLDTKSLSVPSGRRNLYTAHEVLQVKPIFDRGDTYQQFINANRWTRRFLANAYQNLSQKLRPEKQTALSILLAPLNWLSFLVQYLYMLPKITTEKVSLHSAYFHKIDLSSRLKKHLHNLSQKTI